MQFWYLDFDAKLYKYKYGHERKYEVGFLRYCFKKIFFHIFKSTHWLDIDIRDFLVHNKKGIVLF